MLSDSTAPGTKAGLKLLSKCSHSIIPFDLSYPTFSALFLIFVYSLYGINKDACIPKANKVAPSEVKAGRPSWRRHSDHSQGMWTLASPSLVQSHILSRPLRVSQRGGVHFLSSDLSGGMGEKGSPRPHLLRLYPWPQSSPQHLLGTAGLRGGGGVWCRPPFQCQLIGWGFAASTSSQHCLCQELLTVVPQPKLCSSSRRARLCGFLFSGSWTGGLLSFPPKASSP